MAKKIAVAVSGGVDSLGAMLLLKEAGHEVFAVHALLKEHDSPNGNEQIGLGRICENLGVPFHVIDLRDHFAKLVVDAFARDYGEGRTPNPCAVCNRSIKFGLLLDAILNLGAEHLATGHYAAIVQNPYRSGLLLASAADRRKDQSYFLALVDPTALGRLIFPCASKTKEQIRSIARIAGFNPPVAKESQDACFSGTGWQSLVISRLSEKAPACQPGEIWLKKPDGTLHLLGRHSGLWKYTAGQRRGLGFAGPQAWHVLEKRLEERQLLLGPAEMLGMKSLLAKDCNFFVPPGLWPEKIFAKTRYRQERLPVSVQCSGKGMLASFPVPAFPSAPGQILALYDAQGRMLAGGIIEETEGI